MIDISRYLDTNTVAWPGDQPFSVEQTLSLSEGSSVNLTAIKTSVHNGTHADAPNHYNSDGATIDGIPLSTYVGPCIVVDAVGQIEVDASTIEAATIKAGDRVLIKTRAPGDPLVWQDRNPHLSLESVIALSACRCQLIGIDSPSVDPSQSTELPAHHALGEAGIHILENLDLDAVDPGRYMLIAMPLKLRGLDASPVRAILLTEDEWLAFGASPQ